MGEIIVKPTLVVPKIVVKMDTNETERVDKVMQAWGKTMPVISINDQVVGSGIVRNFSASVGINKLPSFSMTLDDSDLSIRKSLNKNKVDTCTIVIGFKTWHINVFAVITSCTSNANSMFINISAMSYNEKLYGTEQAFYNDKTVTEIFSDVCTKTGMGLYVTQNDPLKVVHKKQINAGSSHFEFIGWMLKNKTDNMLSIDLFNFIHLANVENLRKQPVDKFSLDRDGKKIKEQDIILTSVPFSENKNGSKDTTIDEQHHIKFLSYAINSNYGHQHVTNKNVLNVFGVGDPEYNGTAKMYQTEIGIGTKNINTFAGFDKDFNDLYANRVNNQIAGRSIKVELENFILFEITPFSIVDLRLYLPSQTIGNVVNERMDQEHSGKKIVIGYTYSFTAASSGNEIQSFKQTLDLI